MQTGLGPEPWDSEAWAFGGVDLKVLIFAFLLRTLRSSLDTQLDHSFLLQSLQAELAAAKQEKQILVELPSASSVAVRNAQSKPSSVDGNTAASSLQPVLGGSLPPKAPVSSSSPASVTSKQPPLRSLSWGSSTRATSKGKQLLRSSTVGATPEMEQPNDSPQQIHQQQLQQQQHQSSQLGAQHAVIEHWLSQEHVPVSSVSDAMDSEAVRQEVLQEVFQAVAAKSSTITPVGVDSLTVKASQYAST